MTPSSPGSPSGLRVWPCMSAPDMPSAAPTIRPEHRPRHPQLLDDDGGLARWGRCRTARATPRRARATGCRRRCWPARRPPRAPTRPSSTSSRRLRAPGRRARGAAPLRAGASAVVVTACSWRRTAVGDVRLTLLPRRREPALGQERYRFCRRLPPCQSSVRPASSVRTPNEGSWGRSRRLRLSSAKPGNDASATTWSHSATASSSAGSRLMTGPKKATPSGGRKCRIGVPTSLPVRASASSVSSWICSSQESSSRAVGELRREPRLGQHRVERTRGCPGARRHPGRPATSKTCAPSAAYSRSTASGPCSARARARRAAGAGRRCAPPRTPAGSGSRSRCAR